MEKITNQKNHIACPVVNQEARSPVRQQAGCEKSTSVPGRPKRKRRFWGTPPLPNPAQTGQNAESNFI